MVMKGYSAFPEAPALLKPPHQIVYCHNRTLIGVLTLFRGGARGVPVIIVGNGHSNTSSNPERD